MFPEPLRIAGPPIDLHGLQRELFFALSEVDPRLGHMYAGALVTLRDGSNPDRIAQCAHSLRELIETLPQVMDIVVVPLPDLVSRVGGLARALADAQKGPAYLDGAWHGPINGSLRILITQVEELADSREVARRMRREVVTETLTALVDQERVLPDPMLDVAVRDLMDARAYFTRVSHHQPTTDVDLVERLTGLERLLFSYLRRRTFAEFDEIDAIVNEAERDD